MIQKNRIAYIVVGMLVVFTLISICGCNKRAPHKVYPGSQGERVKTWNDMHRLKLTDENISAFVDAILSNQTLPAPKGTSAVSPASISEIQKADIREALVGFFMAYRGDAPEPVYNYLTVSRGPTQLIPAIKGTLGTTNKTDKEVFEYVWNMGSKGIGWEFFLDESGLCCFWEAHVPLTADQSLQLVLEDPALFSNTTAAGHVFTISLKAKKALERGEKLLFCDAFFVTELNKAKDQDFCAMGVRFWFDEASAKWIPGLLLWVTPKIRQDIQVPF